MALDIRHYAGLSPGGRRDLERELGSVATLEDALQWVFALSPPRALVDIVIQDEFTHDVAMKWTDQHYLVFDAT